MSGHEFVISFVVKGFFVPSAVEVASILSDMLIFQCGSSSTVDICCAVTTKKINNDLSATSQYFVMGSSQRY